MVLTLGSLGAALIARHTPSGHEQGSSCSGASGDKISCLLGVSDSDDCPSSSSGSERPTMQLIHMRALSAEVVSVSGAGGSNLTEQGVQAY